MRLQQISLQKKHTAFLLWGGILAVCSLIACFPLSALAASPSDYFPSGYFSGFMPTDDPVTVALNIIKTLLQVLGVVVVLFIVYGGYLIMSGGGILGVGDYAGKSTQIKKGKDVIQWAVIGAIIILSALGIVSYLDSALFA